LHILSGYVSSGTFPKSRTLTHKNPNPTNIRSQCSGRTLCSPSKQLPESNLYVCSETNVWFLDIGSFMVFVRKANTWLALRTKTCFFYHSIMHFVQKRSLTFCECALQEFIYRRTLCSPINIF